jgi:hypothetical protein
VGKRENRVESVTEIKRSNVNGALESGPALGEALRGRGEEKRNCPWPEPVEKETLVARR